MADMNDYNKAYDEGYQRGKDSGWLEDIVHNNKSLIPGTESKYDKSYDAGFNDGATEKYDDSNSNYNGGTSEDNGSICFITTACMMSKGLPDNCKEIETLREFRNKYVLNLPNGTELNFEYKKIAPLIVRGIQESGDSKNIYESIYSQITAMIELIAIGDNWITAKLPLKI